MAWLIPLTIFLIPAYLYRLAIFGIPTTLFELLIYVCVIAIIVVQPLSLTLDRLKPIYKTYGLWIALLIIGSFIGLIIAPDKTVALGLLKAYIIDPILLFAVIIVWVDAPVKQQQVLYGLIGSGLLLAVSAIFGPKTIDGRAIGLYGLDLRSSPNFLALYLAPVMALVLGLYSKSQPKIFKLLLIATELIMAIALIMTQSRGGLLAFIFSLVLIQIHSTWPHRPKGHRRLFWAGTVILLLTLVGIASWLAKPDFSQEANHRATTSNNLRYEIWRTTIVDIIPSHFLTGVGLGNYQAHFTQLTNDRPNYPEYIAPWARTPHNLLLNIWVNLGFIGLVGFIGIIFQFFRQQIPIQPVGTWRFAVLIAMIALLIHGLVDAPFWKNDLSALFWVLIALGYLTKSNQAKES